MAYTAIDDVQPGQYLGQTIYSETGSILLHHGVKLSFDYIKRLKKRGYQSLLVFDEIDKDVEMPTLISPKTRQTAVNLVQGVFASLNQNGSNRKNRDLLKRVDLVAEEIFDEIEHHESLAADIVNLKCVSSYTFEHSVNVGILSGFIGLHSGLNMPAVRDLIKSGIYHDIGKTFVDNDILEKPGKLTDEEMDHVRKHPVDGFKLLMGQLNVSPIISIGSRLHHEWWDGTGYPNGAIGEEIHKYGRIIAVIDVFDAMTSDRVYRRGLPHSTVLEYIRQQTGTQFDPTVVKILQEIMYPYPTGSSVLLNTGDVATVMQNFARHIEKPLVKITSPPEKAGKLYDLNKTGDDLYIVKPA